MSAITFLHTADWQLGKPFASLRDDAKRHRLQRERLEVIRRIGAAARETGAAFVLVAGDLFDSPQATKDTVSSACAAIGSIGVPVLVIPGNHDHGGPGSIWEREFFLREQRQLAPNLHILLKPEPVVIEGAAVIFPAPLLRRHEPGDPSAWIRQAAAASDLPDPSDLSAPPSPLAAAWPRHLPRIVLAHGTIQGFGSTSQDEEDAAGIVNWIDLTRLPADELDYIALGDWHGAKQITPKTWYSGTPETDRFPKGDNNTPGHLLKVTAARAAAPQVEILPTGRFAWKELTFRFSDDASLDLFAAKLDELIGPRGDEHLLLLTLEGALGFEASTRLEQILESWEARLLRLKLDHRVTIAPSDPEITALTQRAGDPLIASVAAQLLADLENPAEAETARLALRELHAACAP